MELNNFQKTLPSFIIEMAEKYGLKIPQKHGDNSGDFWNCHGNWIIKHDGCEKIADHHDMKFEIPTQNYDVSPNIALLIKGSMVAVQEDGDHIERYEKVEWSFGEANGKNTKMPYWWAMAEKRGKDRVILKLINAYEKGLYSSVEADEFKQGDGKGSDSWI